MPSVSLNRISSTVTMLYLPERQVLFSYDTAVACSVYGEDGQEGWTEYILDPMPSPTSRRHVTQHHHRPGAVKVSAAQMAVLVGNTPPR